MQKVTHLLWRVVFQTLPPIPALNEWLAQYPVLTWAVLGILMHRLLIRVWARALRMAKMSGQDVNLPAPPADGESAEDKFRRERMKRVARVEDWLKNDKTLMWSTAALCVTEPLARTLGDFLSDDSMYINRSTPDGDGAPSTWWPARHDGQQVPTLKSQMESEQKHLRRVQKQVCGVMLHTQGDDKLNFVQQAFPVQSKADVCHALQNR